jgi:2-phosphosulfolactate phosphatase
VVGCFLNADPVVDFIRSVDTPVAILCAGRQNRLSLEDTLCAGLILDRLWDGEEPRQVTDAAHMAHTQYRQDRGDMAQLLRRCNHAQYLMERGFEDDVAYCLQVDGLPALPYYTENRLVLRNGDDA